MQNVYIFKTDVLEDHLLFASTLKTDLELEFYEPN